MNNDDAGYTSPAEIPSQVDEQLLRSAKLRGRRSSVSAECDIQETDSSYVPAPRGNKSPSECERILSSVKDNFLFASLDEDQRDEIIDAMVEKHVDAGTTIIQQGDEGDYFYILDSGSCEVLVNDKKVFEYNDSGAFGELALMYSAPRAATVRSTTPCTLWQVDRITFHHILLVSKSHKRQLYEAFLQNCPLFTNLSIGEIQRLADVLHEQTYKAGEVVIQEGDNDTSRMQFYIVQEGEAEAYQTLSSDDHVDEKKSDSKHQVLVGTMKKGEFFGERALVAKEPRAATVVAKTNLKVATLDVAGFERLLGPCREIMEGTIADYPTAADVTLEQKQ